MPAAAARARPPCAPASRGRAGRETGRRGARARPSRAQTERFWGGWDECYPRPPEEQRCQTCLGFARVKCKHCHGAGRLNYTDEPLLPKGVRPMFCPSCRGSGLAVCDACWGSGVKRRPVGFSVPGMDGEA